MKAVLKSIKPYFAYLIIKGLKSLELSKTQPQDEDFSGQVFIYFTKDKKSFNKIPKDEREIFKKYIGKICGCFTCDRILIDKTFGHDPNFIGQANLSQIEAAWYCTQSPIYGWHISDLKIYDKPKELFEFYKGGMLSYDDWLYAIYRGNGGATSRYESYKNVFKMKRPPQSWCYVEEIYNE